MRVECIHGYFKFVEYRPGQISDFMSRYGLRISRAEDHFTFTDLVGAPDYSIEGGTFLGCLTTETYEGPPWEVMRVNKIVYDFAKGVVVPIASVSNTITMQSAGRYLLTDGMIIPGSVTDDGKRVTDYAAHYEDLHFKYSEVTTNG